MNPLYRSVVLAALIAVSACKQAAAPVASVKDETPAAATPAPNAADPISEVDAEKIATDLATIFFNPAEGREKLQSDLYWCAIYALWTAFPAGRATSKSSLKTFIKQNASGKFGHYTDLVNVMNGFRKVASDQTLSAQQKITTAFSLMQIINAKLGGGTIVGGALNVADTIAGCTTAIIAGSDQLIKDINKLNEEYSPRQIMEASNEALGSIAGPVVGSFIVVGGQVTKAGDALGDAAADVLYPNKPTAPLSTPDNRVSCCYICRQEFRSNTLFGERAPGNTGCGQYRYCGREVRGADDCNDHDSDWIGVAGEECRNDGAANGNTFYRYSDAKYGGMIPADDCRPTNPNSF